MSRLTHWATSEMERELRLALKNGDFGDVEPSVSHRNRAIKSRNTGPEAVLRDLVREIYPGQHQFNANLQGSPDILIGALGIAIFCDGCFFHGCPKHGHVPSRNREYWKLKIEKNKKRDRRTNAMLRRQGYRVVRIWEHDLKVAAALPRVKRRLLRTIDELRACPANDCSYILSCSPSFLSGSARLPYRGGNLQFPKF